MNNCYRYVNIGIEPTFLPQIHKTIKKELYRELENSNREFQFQNDCSHGLEIAKLTLGDSGNRETSRVSFEPSSLLNLQF